MKLIDMVKGPVTFEFYRKGFLFYKTHNGILFMRYIRKEMEEK